MPSVDDLSLGNCREPRRKDAEVQSAAAHFGNLLGECTEGVHDRATNPVFCIGEQLHKIFACKIDIANLPYGVVKEGFVHPGTSRMGVGGSTMLQSGLVEVEAACGLNMTQNLFRTTRAIV